MNRTYNVSKTRIAAFAAAFAALTYIYACMRALGAAKPFDVFDALAAGFGVIYIIISAIAVLYLADLIKRKIKKLGKPDLSAGTSNVLRACVCVFAAFLLEITFFQYNHYGTVWADGYADIFGWEDLSTSMQNTTDKTGAPVFIGVRDETDLVIEFDNLNRRVSSVRIEPYFDEIEGFKTNTMSCVVFYDDEEAHGRNTIEYTIVDGLKQTGYIPIYAIGNISDLTVVFTSGYAAFTNVAVNETIPLTPVALRVFIVAGLIFVIGTIRRYNIFAVRFNAASKRQNALFAAVLTLICAYCGFTAIAGYVPGVSDSEPTVYHWDDQYNHLADAFAAGRLNIEVGPAPGILYNAADTAGSERPYDQYYRGINNIPHPFDAVMYDGKFYVYDGVIPCILLYLPYNLITGGRHLPGWIASFLFCAAAIVFLSTAWREIVKKLFPNIPLIMFLLGVFAVSFCSFAPFIVVMPRQYEVATLSGLAFAALGLYLLLKYSFSGRKKTAVLVFACLSFAFAVGCRPTTVFWSVFVPIMVWGEVKNKETRLKTIIAVALPYIVTAIPLMWYNYARFGNIAEFGVTYVLASVNHQIRLKNITPAEFMYFFMMGGLEGYTLKLPAVTSDFPFVTTVNISQPYRSLVEMFDSGVVGMLALPVVWFMIKARSAFEVLNGVSRKTKRAVIAGWGVCLLIAVIGPIVGGVVVRYSVDFIWFPVLSSLIVICALLYKYSGSVTGAVTEKLSCAAILASGLIGFAGTFIGACTQIMRISPNVYYYLKNAMTFFSGS